MEEFRRDIWEVVVGKCLTPKETKKSLDLSCRSFVHSLHLPLLCRSIHTLSYFGSLFQLTTPPYWDGLASQTTLPACFSWLIFIATSAHLRAHLWMLVKMCKRL